LYFLCVDGKRIAFGYFLEYADKLYLLKPGYDPRFGKYSPATLLLHRVLRDAFEKGLAEVDLLGNADWWRLRWTSRVRANYWLHLFPDQHYAHFLHWTRFRARPWLGRRPLLRALRDAAR